MIWLPIWPEAGKFVRLKAVTTLAQPNGVDRFAELKSFMIPTMSGACSEPKQGRNLTHPVRTERRNGVLVVVIDRPERRNALNEAVALGVIEALDEAETDRSVRAIVLTGAGEIAFCAGGDLQPAADGTPFAIEPADPRHYVVSLLRRMEFCRLPIIARVNGHALAGGFGLVCACDLAVAREDALLGVTEVRVGLFPMMILPYLLRALPYRTMMELCLTGEPVTGTEAHRAGIVNYAVTADQLDAKVEWLAERVTSKSPTGIRLGKQALFHIRDMPTASALEYAQFMLANMARTMDVKEGFAAFHEKRAPQWTGR